MLVRFSVSNGCGIFFCPKGNHRVPVNGRTFSPGHSWDWNGSETLPTLSPSLHYTSMDPATRCHSFINDGRIMFLIDSYHELAGQTVDLPEWPGK